jgi:hypothetical protein
LPETARAGGRPVARWHDTEFRAFQTAVAVTTFAIGEFPWAVAVGDRVTAQDFVSPPFMLSSECTPDEVTWSLGEYVSGDRVWEAFKLEGKASAPRGVYANQPNPLAGRAGALWRTFGILVLAIVALVLVRGTTASNALVFSGAFTFTPGVADSVAAFVTEPFELGGATGNVVVRTAASVDNSWIYLSYSLINERTGDALELGREVSYYHGIDSDGSWSEGSHDDEARIPAVPAGRWFLRIAPEGPPSGTPIHYTVQVRRDAAGVLPFTAAFVLLLLPPLLTSLRSHAFETHRWAESDYAPVASGNDSDSGDD